MNLSAVGQSPDLVSIVAMMSVAPADLESAAGKRWASDGLGDRGGVRQAPPADSIPIRRIPTDDPDADLDQDDEPPPSMEE